MILIAFPHYTCGGLLCDILSENFSPMDPVSKAIYSFQHSLGKIGDSDSVYTDYNPDEFQRIIDQIPSDEKCVGTHCWPGRISLSRFSQVICITTMTYRSKVYRWSRCFYNYYQHSDPWQLTGMELIDKQRETAKNYLTPFEPVPGAVNIEFSDIVEGQPSFLNIVQDHNYQLSLDRWRQANDFLYHADFWNTIPVKRFHEAESEILCQQRYVYQ